ncbi:MAG TPA: GNAT family N-acetyltransferase [Methylomirabilota bacterium]|nr:GNAT family N-acetyltransferase [Methylomirabilota bacterium]
MAVLEPRPTVHATAAATVTYRPAAPVDLPACGAIWRAALNDYMGRLNLPEVPNDLAAILRIHRHLQATDPAGFLVAEEATPEGDVRIVAFAAAVRRGAVWFLSMLFVLPEAQAAGIGRALLARLLPPQGTATMVTCTDAAQPISNGLYASLGMVPRMPLLRLVGLAERPTELPSLPVGVRAIGFDEVDRGGDRIGGAALDDEIAALDRDAVGFDHPVDHAMVRTEGRLGFLFLGPDGGPVGYGYASEAGRVGPIAVRDSALLGPVIGHLVTTVRPRGAFGLWLPGAAEGTVGPLLRAGFRLEGFPCLLCWDRPFADFARYVPISPSLL